MVRSRSGSAMGVGLVLCVLVASGGEAMGAEPSKAPSDAALAEAALLYETGFAASREGSWERARASLLAAWKTAHHEQIAVNLGQAELKTGHYRDAAEHLSFFLREAKEAGEADRRAAEEMFKEARAKVGALRVAVEPVGAEVLVDNVSLGKAPLADVVFVDPGAHVITARQAGFVTAKADYKLDAGGTEEVSLRLARMNQEGLSPSPPTDVLSTPPPRADVIETGPKWWWIAAGVTGTAALAGVGTGLALMSNSRAAASYENGEPIANEDRFNELQAQKSAFGFASLGTFIAAGAVGGVTLYYVLKSHRPEPKPTVGVQASAFVGPGSGGAWIRGAW